MLDVLHDRRGRQDHRKCSLILSFIFSFIFSLILSLSLSLCSRRVVCVDVVLVDVCERGVVVVSLVWCVVCVVFVFWREGMRRRGYGGRHPSFTVFQVQTCVFSRVLHANMSIYLT